MLPSLTRSAKSTSLMRVRLAIASTKRKVGVGDLLADQVALAVPAQDLVGLLRVRPRVGRPDVTLDRPDLVPRS